MTGAGYSGTPLPKKLGIKEGTLLATLHAPSGFDETLGDLPADVERGSRTWGRGSTWWSRSTRRGRCSGGEWPRLSAAAEPDGTVWIAWPKKASKVATDITEDVLREELLPTGWVDNKVCAIDDTSSGLRLALRRERADPTTRHDPGLLGLTDPARGQRVLGESPTVAEATRRHRAATGIAGDITHRSGRGRGRVHRHRITVRLAATSVRRHGREGASRLCTRRGRRQGAGDRRAAPRAVVGRAMEHGTAVGRVAAIRELCGLPTTHPCTTCSYRRSSGSPS